MSYELISLQVVFIARVTSYCLHKSYELLFIARVTSYFHCTSCELLPDKIMRTTYSLGSFFDKERMVH